MSGICSISRRTSRNGVVAKRRGDPRAFWFSKLSSIARAVSSYTYSYSVQPKVSVHFFPNPVLYVGRLIIFMKGSLKGNCCLFTFPTRDFIWDSSFVVWDVRNPNPKISRSYELYRRSGPEIFNFQDFKHGFVPCGISATPFSSWFMGLRNKPPPAVDAKPYSASPRKT